MKKTITTAALFAFVLMLAGCNTMHGLGQDVKKVGEKIEDKSKR